MTTEPTPVAYVISAVEGVVDESTVKRYAELTGPAIEHFGGRFIVSNTEPLVVEGKSPSNYLSMVEFPSMEDAKAWYNSPEYAEARDLTPAAFRGRLLIFVEGDPSLSSAFNRASVTSQRSDLIMAKVILGNHAAVVAPKAEQDRIRRFYRDALGCETIRETDEKDDFRMGDNFYIGVLYENEGITLDEIGFSKAIYLELKADNVEEMRQKIVAFGVKVLEMQDPHLYFQAPGGQVFRLVGVNEDLSKYEGTDHRELPGVFG